MRTKAAAVLAVLVLLATGTAMVWADPANAAPTKAPPISDAQYLSIAHDVMANDGVATAAQQGQMNTRPDLQHVVPTRAVPDYRMPGYAEDQATTVTKTVATDSAAATYTTSRDRYLVYDTGFPWYTKVVDYHFVVAWSYNYVNVVGTPSSYTYPKNADGSVQNLGIVTNSQYRNYNASGVYAWTVPLTGKFKRCYSNTCDYYYPQVRFGVYYNGTYNYTVLSRG